MTVFTASDDVEEYVLEGKTVIGPDVYLNDIGFCNKYPSGGIAYQDAQEPLLQRATRRGD